MQKSNSTQSNSTKILTGVAVVLALLGLIVWRSSGAKTKPDTGGHGFYYTGPMKNKDAGSNIYGDDDGNRVAPPPGVATQPQQQQGPRQGREPGD